MLRGVVQAGGNLSLFGQKQSLDAELNELRARVKELERALEGAAWYESWEVHKLNVNGGLTPNEARIVLLLYKAKRGLSARDLNLSLPDYMGIEPEYESKRIRVHVARIRNKWGKEAVRALPHKGYWLTEASRAQVKSILESKYA